MLFSEPVWFVLGWVLFGLQLAIYGSLIARMVTVGDYLFFYSVGLIVMTVFDAAADTGRNFVEHAHRGELPYFLSLPISRRGLLGSIALFGSANTLLRIMPPLIIALFVLGRLTASGLAFATAALFLLGFGVAGIMLAMSFIAFKSVDIYTALTIAVGVVLVRLSTIFYPMAVMPPGYSTASQLSPLSYGADLARWALGFDPSVLLNPYVAVAVVSALAVGTMFLASIVVERLIEGVKAA